MILIALIGGLLIGFALGARIGINRMADVADVQLRGIIEELQPHLKPSKEPPP